jgi:hypothetical protein
MAGIATSPSETDVLRAISELFTAKISAAALAHYPTLRIQTNNLHAGLTSAIQATDRIVSEWSTRLSICANVCDDFRSPARPLFAYRIIAPALVRNLHQAADFLLDEARGAPLVCLDQIGEATPSFSDFVKLGAAVRSFLDSLVQTAYQLATFDGRQINYKFLQSLLSFAAVAPPSLHSNIVSPDMQAALNAFVALSSKERKNSAFTKAAHDQFPQRLALACQAVGFEERRRLNIELLFGFCSDFVHSGYVSVLALGSPGTEIVMGGYEDAFTARAENFAELKQRLLAECAGAYADLFLPVFRQAIGRTLAGGMPNSWADELDRLVHEIGSLREILHRRLVEPVRQGLIGSKTSLRINCMCGGQVDVYPPHLDWDRFCPSCGSRLVLHEVPASVDYVISASGAGDVLGSDATRIGQLDGAVKSKLERITAKHQLKRSRSALQFLLIRDLINCDEDTLEVPSIVTSTPNDADRGQCTLLAFVAAKSLARCAAVRIRCNCGKAVDYHTAEQTNMCRCPGCKTYIGLVGVTGDGESIKILKPDGTPGTAPIFGRDRFSNQGTAT